MTSQWTGFADYVESFGSKPTGKGNNANFDEMLEAALKAEGQPSTMVQERQVAASEKEELINTLPLQFEVEHLISCTANDDLFSRKIRSGAPPIEEREQRYYRLTCGLVIKTRQADIRMVNKGMMSIEKINFTQKNEKTMQVFHTQIKNLCCREDRMFLECHYTAESLWDTAVELIAKRITLSKELCRILERQMLPARDATSGLLTFNADFTKSIQEFFYALKKPLPSSNPADIQSINYDTIMMDSLLALEREECPGCFTFRALYCTDCTGLRTPKASKILPPRIPRAQLPFDILMIFHFQERLQRSTGAHALALIEEGAVEVAFWPRHKNSTDMKNILDSLNPSRDVLLFPDDSAVCIANYDFACNQVQMHSQKENPLFDMSQALESDSPQQRKRLVIIEANWTYAKKMVAFLKQQVTGLQSVCLSNSVVGTYWRFQTVGVSALSTIEAIYHACKQAVVPNEVHRSTCDGSDRDSTRDPFSPMLVLFEYQRRKLLAHGGSGSMRGLQPTGDGNLYEWASYIRKLD